MSILIQELLKTHQHKKQIIRPSTPPQHNRLKFHKNTYVENLLFHISGK